MSQTRIGPVQAPSNLKRLWNLYKIERSWVGVDVDADAQEQERMVDFGQWLVKHYAK